MRILIVNAVFGNKSTGTIVRQLQEHCKKNRIDTYVAYSSADRQDNEVPNGYHIGNIFSKKWHAFASRLFGKQAYYNRFTTWLFLKYIKRIKPDIVHLHNLHSNFINLNMLLNFLSMNNIPTIITMHDCWYFTGGCFHYSSIKCTKWQINCGNCPKRYYDTPAYICDSSKQILSDRRLYLNSLKRLVMVGCSQWIANECKKSILASKDIRYIYNGFDLDVFRSSKSDFRQKYNIENKYIILSPASKWCSNINKETAAYFYKNIQSDTIILLFGCHDLSSTSTKILKIGYVNDPKEMAELYSIADIMVNPSREDTLSSINIECQACGTPVITYDETGNKETVNGKCGKAIKSGDYKLLFDTVMDFKKIGKSNFTEMCINWVYENFNQEKSLDNYIKLYNEIYNK